MKGHEVTIETGVSACPEIFEPGAWRDRSSTNTEPMVGPKLASYSETMATTSKFAVGRLDHVHIRVPNRAEAARWYADHLGFEPVEKFEFWANGFRGGPLQISADGGDTMLALFEATDSHPMIPQKTGVAFSMDAERFMSFIRSLPGELDSPHGRPLVATDVIDFDMCWAIDLVDPWGNQYELNCYEYDLIKTDLIDRDGIVPTRYWPRELYDQHIEG